MNAVKETVAVLHPGSMGAAVAACAKLNAKSVLWCSQGRSEASTARAEQAGLKAVESLGELLDRADMLISLCPPAAAEDVAHQVAEHGFRGGLYVEANAISPERVCRIAGLLPEAWAVVDAAVVGSAPTGGKTPTLYLSGPSGATERVDAVFANTAVRTHWLGSDLGQASGLKLSYTAYQKTSRLLAGLSLGIAREHGVDQELITIASRRTDSYLAEPQYIPKTAARAWRWGPELDEAGDMLAAAGIPDDVLRAAAKTLERWHPSKDDAELTLEDALTQLTIPLTPPEPPYDATAPGQ
ncbi:DUF1932 domain-containing protein [Streptomyces celluloflavus]|uniref:DUF1932 domain-containing protein n=1 Tax=Streptomyces celluloflavus TaxID=58344 RepID=UPI0037BB0A60